MEGLFPQVWPNRNQRADDVPDQAGQRRQIIQIIQQRDDPEHGRAQQQEHQPQVFIGVALDRALGPGQPERST